MDRRLVAFARNADVLIHDAQYSEEHYRGALSGFPSTQGYGHSTATMASEVAASAETGELILFHHDPAYTDDMVAAQESAAQKLFPDSRAAYEGLEINLHADPKGFSGKSDEKSEGKLWLKHNLDSKGNP
jgi:ribonuclease BN (tRNA processing enzyme)